MVPEDVTTLREPIVGGVLPVVSKVLDTVEMVLATSESMFR